MATHTDLERRGVKTREDRVQQALYALELERRQARGIGRLLLGGAQRVLLRQVKNVKS